MNIKRSSWHYRLNSWIGGNYATNLCSYFWRTIRSLLLVFLGVVLFPLWGPVWGLSKFWQLLPPAPGAETAKDKLGIAWSYCRGGVLTLWLLGLLILPMWIVGTFSPVKEDYVSGIIVSGFMGLMFGALIVVIVSAEGKFSGPGRQDDLFAMWLRAKKDKVCPLITFVD